LAKRAKSQDLLQWALAGAKDRLSALAEEMQRIYRTFPSLRSGGTRVRRTAVESAQKPKGGRKRRRMSAAGRAKLRAATKRRWAEAKKAGKKRLG
jgi:hypothetical protein